MADPGHDAQPDVETFSYAGGRVDIVDAAGILATAALRRVDLSTGDAFPEPVREVRLHVRGGPGAGSPIRLHAEIHTDDDGWRLTRELVLGRDPLGTLLAWRAAAGDPWANRVVEKVGAVAAMASRRLGRPAPGRPDTGHDDLATVLDDDAAGFPLTVTLDDVAGASGRVVRLHAAVPAAQITSEHLQAMFRLVLRAVVDLLPPPVDEAPLAGRHYVLSADPAAPVVPAPTPVPAPMTTETVTLDQVGGLVDVVAEMRQIAVSFRHPEAMARWGARRPQGILMYGPPGTGKTMLARALANEIGATFREIRTPEILDKWLGGSERNIKRIFRDARRYREPTVMLFDEFDSIISYAGSGDDAASQAINAVAGIFKQEMNTLIEDNPNVIVVATTNFPHRVDDSLIRSGRFDIKIAVPLPDEASRAEIIAKMIRQLADGHAAPGFRMFADDLDLGELARISVGMTGADLKEVLRRVQLAKAMQEARAGRVAPPISQDELRDSVLALGGARAG
jgi:transitional endoplasmic reticulum ATPase